MSDWTPEAVAELEIRLRNGTLDRLTFDAADHAENQAAYGRTTAFFAHYRELRSIVEALATDDAPYDPSYEGIKMCMLCANDHLPRGEHTADCPWARARAALGGAENKS